MYVRVRDLSKKPGEQDSLITISKSALIEELRKEVLEKTGVVLEKQRLYYKGKQLIDGHRIIDYNIQLNDVIQLMIKADVLDAVPSTPTTPTVDEPSPANQQSLSREKGESKYYEVKDLVDYMDPDEGAWFEGAIVDIFKNRSVDEPIPEANKEPDLIFMVKNVISDCLIELSFHEILPRAHYCYKPEELSLGLTVFANYNMEKPNSRGFWFEYTITRKTATFVQGTIIMGKNKTAILDRTVKFIDEMLRIEKPVLLSERSSPIKNIPLRKTAYSCEKCQDRPNKKCSECGCKVCSGKQDSAKILLCDECNSGYHIMCLDPPLSEIPSDPEWYCPECKTDPDEIVKAGDKLKFSQKKAKSASANSNKKTRDWGHGMATVGRSTECTTASKHHLGPIPGIPVGTCWGFRVQVSESGVHRPQVAGIHGCENKYAFSLVLSGGYDDDIDNGEEFIYSGAGGRDLSGNKRVSEQCKDQELTRTNRALALNCNTTLNENGGEAKDWKGGKPIRVVRNFKLKSRSKYAPLLGNRYDGIYKVVKYYREKGKSGYYVWKYLLRRDDPEPAPWHKDGQNLEVQYPASYLEAKSQKENRRLEANKQNGNSKEEPKGRRSKRTASPVAELPQKKIKIQPFVLDDEVSEYIMNDVSNKKIWDEAKEILDQGQKKFLEKVEGDFTCVCCQELLYQPVTMDCKHSVCKACMKRSFASEIYNCPYCRLPLEKDYNMPVNNSLQSALTKLFPGYNTKR